MPRELEKRERNLGVKLSMRGDRSESPKAAIIRRPFRSGQHGKSFQKKLSDFGLQLKEKQKLRFTYGLTNKNLGEVLKKSSKSGLGLKTDILIQKLELRLDSVVYRLGFGASRSITRQLVSHGQFLVNGKRATTPSIQVKIGDVISVKPGSRDNNYFQNVVEKLKNFDAPVWLSLDKEKMEGKVVSVPTGVDSPFDINLVVDFYSK